MNDQAIVITTTSDTKVTLESITARLLAERLAACVQISGPVESWYSWQGETECSREWQCVIKTMACHFEAVEQVISSLHHYEVPQIVSFEITRISASYLQWINDSIN